MTERPGEFGMSNIGIIKNYKLHRYPNAIRKPEIKGRFTSHKIIGGRQINSEVDCPYSTARRLRLPRPQDKYYTVRQEQKQCVS